MKSEELERRVDNSYEKYGWTEEQRKVFDKFIDERYANFRKPENTLRSYLDLLNQVVLKIQKPFSEITYDDLIPLLRDWQNRYGKSTMHGRKCKRQELLCVVLPCSQGITDGRNGETIPR